MLLVRRVVGNSMLPVLTPGTVILAWTRPIRLRPGDIVVLRHDGIEKIKRVRAVDGRRVYVLGDNAAASTDSRAFGWLDRSIVRGRVWWPFATIRHSCQKDGQVTRGMLE
jgi:nickel-type superoxide dismutase maturation protease